MKKKTSVINIGAFSFILRFLLFSNIEKRPLLLLGFLRNQVKKKKRYGVGFHYFVIEKDCCS
jgi:hypothetical protein